MQNRRRRPRNAVTRMCGTGLVVACALSATAGVTVPAQAAWVSSDGDAQPEVALEDAQPQYLRRWLDGEDKDVFNEQDDGEEEGSGVEISKYAAKEHLEEHSVVQTGDVHGSKHEDVVPSPMGGFVHKIREQNEDDNDVVEQEEEERGRDARHPEAAVEDVVVPGLGSQGKSNDAQVGSVVSGSDAVDARVQNENEAEDEIKVKFGTQAQSQSRSQSQSQTQSLSQSKSLDQGQADVNVDFDGDGHAAIHYQGNAYKDQQHDESSAKKTVNNHESLRTFRVDASGPPDLAKNVLHGDLVGSQNKGLEMVPGKEHGEVASKITPRHVEVGAMTEGIDISRQYMGKSKQKVYSVDLQVEHQSSVGSNLLGTDPVMQWYYGEPIFAMLVFCVGVLATVVWRDNKFKFAAERFVHVVRRKTHFHFPRLSRKLATLSSSGFGLTKSKLSELHIVTGDKGPKSPNTKEHRKDIAELKLMSLAGKYTPKLRAHERFSSIISEDCLSSLVENLPDRLTCKDWRLLYASETHGYSLHTAYARASNCGPFVIAVMDRNRYVFGAFCSESLRCGGRTYYGTGESFIFQLQPQLRVYGWSGTNDQIVVSNKDMLAFGSGKFALWLDSNFEHGSSEEGSTTFEKYERLASNEMFKCYAVEIWGFTSPSTASPRKSARKSAYGFSMGNPLV